MTEPTYVLDYDREVERVCAPQGYCGPHCDSRVLHAPGICEHCDKFPELQAYRKAHVINFTGDHIIGQLVCPAEVRRSLAVINRWPSNTTGGYGKWFGMGPDDEDDDEDDIPDTRRPSPGWLASYRRITRQLVDKGVLPRWFRAR